MASARRKWSVLPLRLATAPYSQHSNQVMTAPVESSVDWDVRQTLVPQRFALALYSNCDNDTETTAFPSLETGFDNGASNAGVARWTLFILVSPHHYCTAQSTDSPASPDATILFQIVSPSFLHRSDSFSHRSYSLPTSTGVVSRTCSDPYSQPEVSESDLDVPCLSTSRMALWSLLVARECGTNPVNPAD